MARYISHPYISYFLNIQLLKNEFIGFVCGDFTLPSNPAGDEVDLDRIVGGFVPPPHTLPYHVGIW